MACVYAICFPNGKLYVGIAKRSAEKRLRRHVYTAKKGSPYRVHRAIVKYGVESIYLATLRSEVSWAEAKELEKFYISEWELTSHNSGYNMTAGGDGVSGLVQSERGIAAARANQTKCPAAAAKALRGKSLSLEHRHKIAEAKRGRSLSNEHRRKLSEAM